MLRIPEAPKSIQKGVPLKKVLGLEAIDYLAQNILYVHPEFNAEEFKMVAIDNLEPLGINERGMHIARALRKYLPQKYEAAINIILASLTPPNIETQGLGLAVLFYHPHSYFIAEYGLDKNHNGENVRLRYQ